MDSETRRVLSTAKGLIARGWCQHALEQDGDLCLLGAINMAEYGKPAGGRHRTDAMSMLSLVVTGRQYAYTELVNWNNAMWRTQDDVIAAFDRALLETSDAQAEPVTRENVTTAADAATKEVSYA